MIIKSLLNFPAFRRTGLAMASLCCSCFLTQAQWTTVAPNIYYSTGNVGIGSTVAPYGKLTINTGVVSTGGTTLGLFGYSNTPANRSIALQQLGNVNTATQYFFMNGGLGSSSALGTPTLTSIYAPSFGMECNDNSLNILTATAGTNVTPVRAMSFLPSGNVLIGKTTQTNGAYVLDVNGNARINKVVVNSTGADFVFDPTYQLPPLRELEAFITAHHHLPDIEPAKQMEKEGLNLGDNQTRLLQKIEELTLYVIELSKKNEILEKKLEALSK